MPYKERIECLEKLQKHLINIEFAENKYNITSMIEGKPDYNAFMIKDYHLKLYLKTLQDCLLKLNI